MTRVAGLSEDFTKMVSFHELSKDEKLYHKTGEGYTFSQSRVQGAEEVDAHQFYEAIKGRDLKVKPDVKANLKTVFHELVDKRYSGPFGFICEIFDRFRNYAHGEGFVSDRAFEERVFDKIEVEKTPAEKVLQAPSKLAGLFRGVGSALNKINPMHIRRMHIVEGMLAKIDQFSLSKEAKEELKKEVHGLIETMGLSGAEKGTDRLYTFTPAVKTREVKGGYLEFTDPVTFIIDSRKGEVRVSGVKVHNEEAKAILRGTAGVLSWGAQKLGAPSLTQQETDRIIEDATPSLEALYINKEGAVEYRFEDKTREI